MEVQSISSAVEPLIQEEQDMKITALFNSIEVFDQVTPTIMQNEQHKVPVLGLDYQYVLDGNKLRPSVNSDGGYHQLIFQKFIMH